MTGPGGPGRPLLCPRRKQYGRNQAVVACPYFALTFLVRSVHPLYDLEQEPLAALRLVEDLLQSVAGGGVAVLIADGNRLSYPPGDVSIVLQEPLDHLTCRHEVVIVICDGLQLSDMA